MKFPVSHSRRKLSLPVRSSNTREAVKPLKDRDRVPRKKKEKR